MLHDISDGFLRTERLLADRPIQTGSSTGNDGPGFFTGPFVSEWQALLIIVGYLILFAGGSALIIARRDVA